MTVIPHRPTAVAEDSPRELKYVRDTTDKVFRGIATGGGAIVVSLMIFVAFFLTINAIPAIKNVGLGSFITTTDWSPETNTYGMAALLVGTILIALVALIVSTPLSLGLALFVTEIARGGLRRFLQTAIDLMAAVPSIVFGLWGTLQLQGALAPLAEWINQWFGWIPLFAVRGVDPSNPLGDPSLFKASTFIAGVVVALMIVPTQTSIMVESFSRAPGGEKEGAFALGATRWGVIQSVVLPFGRGGIVGGTMLGLGRALGETIAIYLIISPVFDIKFRILEKGGNSVAAHIALRYGEASGLAMQALMAAGLTLFIMTMIVNFLASIIISRSRSGADSEA